MISVGIYLLRKVIDLGVGVAIDEHLQIILQEYHDLFEIPADLPPSRLHDHKISLKEGTSPINIWPYMYIAI